MDARKCKNCEWWNIKKIWGERKDKASCRREPPRIKVGGMACNKTAEWPSTHSDDWCASYQMRSEGPIEQNP